MLWLKDMDRNTSYFKRSARIRRMMNTVNGLWIHDRWVTSPKELNHFILDLFLRHFAKSRLVDSFDVDFQFSVLSSEETQSLEVGFMEDEVRRTVSSCDGAKAPGPNDFTFEFYKH
ncbi:hypothetical protein V6N12_050708 [Hibiscus sabdariffa]|uniref:Uncharacterized protein n=1 Tax=Hibiscus sabdariffa TaxID=183260 RepID=A0ABR2GDK8_9ROSI